jgi:hypothetical protein
VAREISRSTAAANGLESDHAHHTRQSNGWAYRRGRSLREGSTVTILVPDEGSFTLSREDEAALLESIAEADWDELLDGRDVLNQLP